MSYVQFCSLDLRQHIPIQTQFKLRADQSNLLFGAAHKYLIVAFDCVEHVDCCHCLLHSYDLKLLAFFNLCAE